jgi:DNA-binding transcriptional ArsR family regulator
MDVGGQLVTTANGGEPPAGGGEGYDAEQDAVPEPDPARYSRARALREDGESSVFHATSGFDARWLPIEAGTGRNRDIFTSMKMSSQVAPAADECLVRCVEPTRVAKTKERLIDVDVAEEQAEIFKLLGEPGRLRMLHALADAGELCVCDLAATIDGTETAVSHAMRLLRAAGVVRNRRDGRMVYYRLADDRVRALLELAQPAVTGR